MARAEKVIWWHWLFVLLVGLPCFAAAGAGMERFLVVERVDRLVVYDRYQQQASDDERRLLAPFLPMRIIAADEVLGDGFTRCMKVSVAGVDFYLLKEGGTLAGGGALGQVKTIEGVTALSDTVILRGPAGPLRATDGGRERPLARGDRLARYLHRGEDYYVGLIAAQPVYGWLRVRDGERTHLWHPITTAIPTASSQADVVPRVLESVRRIVDRVNRVLAVLYARLNRETRQDRPVPRWRCTPAGAAVACILENAESGYPRSTEAIAREIGNAVIGTGFEVASAPGRIEVRRP